MRAMFLSHRDCIEAHCRALEVDIQYLLWPMWSAATDGASLTWRRPGRPRDMCRKTTPRITFAEWKGRIVSPPRSDSLNSRLRGCILKSLNT